MEYQFEARRRMPRRTVRVSPDIRAYVGPRGSIVTLIEPAIRNLVSLATEDTYLPVHANSLAGAARELADRRACAMLVSPGMLVGDGMGELAGVIAKHPGVFPIVILHEHGRAVSERLLHLGKVGVAAVVDLQAEGGFNVLRNTIDENGSIIARRISAGIETELPTAGVSSREFFRILVRLAPTHSCVRDVASYLGTCPSTLMSKFQRAKLPSPKQYLSRTRLLYASAYLETPALSIADVSKLLEYSSPQSFGRHLRTQLCLNGSAFRKLAYQELFEGFATKFLRQHQLGLARLEPFRG